MRSFKNYLKGAILAVAFVTLASTLPAVAETVESERRIADQGAFADSTGRLLYSAAFRLACAASIWRRRRVPR